MIDPLVGLGLRAEIVAEARTWIDTPFKHQHRFKGHGVDCIGLAWSVGETVGVLQVDEERSREFRSYGRLPSPERMGRALATFMLPLPPEADIEPGDVAWMAWDAGRELPMHLAILGEHGKYPTIIHAYAGAGKVVEHGLAAEWPGRVKSWWRYPGVG